MPAVAGRLVRRRQTKLMGDEPYQKEKETDPGEDEQIRLQQRGLGEHLRGRIDIDRAMLGVVALVIRAPQREMRGVEHGEVGVRVRPTLRMRQMMAVRPHDAEQRQNGTAGPHDEGTAHARYRHVTRCFRQVPVPPDGAAERHLRGRRPTRSRPTPP